MKQKKVVRLVSFAVDDLETSRLLRAGLLEVSGGGHPQHVTDQARQGLARGDAVAAARSDWLGDESAVGGVGLKKLLRGWHDASALAAVDHWPIDHYDLVHHPWAIERVDSALAELRRRFPAVHALLRAKCKKAGLPTLLYLELPTEDRVEAARLAVAG